MSVDISYPLYVTLNILDVVIGSSVVNEANNSAKSVDILYNLTVPNLAYQLVAVVGIPGIGILGETHSRRIVGKCIAVKPRKLVYSIPGKILSSVYRRISERVIREIFGKRIYTIAVAIAISAVARRLSGYFNSAELILPTTYIIHISVLFVKHRKTSGLPEILFSVCPDVVM